MPHRKRARDDQTPAGRLDEAPLKSVLGYQLVQAEIVTAALFAAHVGTPLGLRPVEYTVLTLIQENPGGSMVRLARALAVTAPVVTVLIDRLQQRGLVARSQSTLDRRAQVLHTTEAGAALAREATARILAAECAALPLTAGERGLLLELLHRVACARGG